MADGDDKKVISLENLRTFKGKIDELLDKKVTIQQTAQGHRFVYGRSAASVEEMIEVFTSDGTANTLVSRNADGKIQVTETPTADNDAVNVAYVKSALGDVKEVYVYVNKAAFPTTGVAEKIYIDGETNLMYQWSGTAYDQLGYLLGETSVNAYPGDKGAQNATTIGAIIDGTQVVGEATKASQDGDGNVISTTYAKATDLDNYVKRVTTSGNQRLYGITGGGTDTVYTIDTNATAGTIPQRTQNGELAVGTPTATSSATTKKYVDDSLSNKVDKASSPGHILIYGVDATGKQTTYIGNTSAESGSVAIRGDGGRLAVGTPTADDDAATKKYVDDKVSTVYKYKGSVANYSDLPTENNEVGDVYNVENADPEHGIKAGDNVAWTGTTWDVLGGTIDLSNYATKDDLDNKLDKVTGQTAYNQVYVKDADGSQIMVNYIYKNDDVTQGGALVALDESGFAYVQTADITGGPQVKTVINYEALTTFADTYLQTKLTYATDAEIVALFN